MTLSQLMQEMEVAIHAHGHKQVAFAIRPLNTSFGFPSAFQYRLVTEDEEVLIEWTVGIHEYNT